MSELSNDAQIGHASSSAKAVPETEVVTSMARECAVRIERRRQVLRQQIERAGAELEELNRIDQSSIATFGGPMPSSAPSRY